jgi:predicted acetyltransferase
MLTLVAPSVARHAAWLASHREWGPGLHEDGYGVGADDEVETADGFARFVQRVTALPAARMWWVLDEDEVVGGIALRTAESANVLQRGHVGYGVRPSARGRGIATWALGEVLRRAPESGLNHVLLVCLDDNIPSIKTIERHRGVLEHVVNDGGVRVRRYWIDLTQGAMRREG